MVKTAISWFRRKVSKCFSILLGTGCFDNLVNVFHSILIVVHLRHAIGLIEIVSRNFNDVLIESWKVGGGFGEIGDRLRFHALEVDVSRLCLFLFPAHVNERPLHVVVNHLGAPIGTLLDLLLVGRPSLDAQAYLLQTAILQDELSNFAVFTEVLVEKVSIWTVKPIVNVHVLKESIYCVAADSLWILFAGWWGCRWKVGIPIHLIQLYGMSKWVQSSSSKTHLILFE